MPGVLGYGWREGNRCEYLAQYFLSAIGISVPVIRQEDIGTDFHCMVAAPDRGRVTFHSPFAVQSGSVAGKDFVYGGYAKTDRRKKKWRKAGLDWLFGHEVPLLVSTVDLSAAVLVHCETEEAPSEETARMLITRCVEQHKMLPSTITFDWGPEGKSTWLQMTMERLGVTVVFRPKATPGSGTNIETLWRKLCQDLLHRLKGSTRLLQKARMVTQAVNPHNRSVWTQAGTRQLLDEYYELINDLPRRGRMAPNAVLADCLAKFGAPPTQVPDAALFRRMLLPFVDDIVRTVSSRGCVRHREHSYYNDELRWHEGKELVVRHDPDIIKKVWVTLPDNRQIECDVVDTALKYLSEEEAMAHHNRVRADAKKRADEVDSRKAAFVSRVGRIQKSMEAQKRAAQRPPRKPKAPPSPKATQPKIAPASKIVAMPIQLQQVVSS